MEREEGPSGSRGLWAWQARTFHSMSSAIGARHSKETSNCGSARRHTDHTHAASMQPCGSAKYTRALRLLANSTRMGQTAAGDRAEKSPTQGRRRWEGEGAVSAAAKAVVALTWNGLSKRAGLSRTVTLVTLTQALRGCECTGGGERTRRGPARARAGGASARRACRRPSLVSQRT